MRITDARYRRLRAMILATEPLCRTCRAAGVYVSATELDHIKPRHRGGAVDDISNLQPLCAECHEAKTEAEGSKQTQRKRFAVCIHGTPAGKPCRLCTDTGPSADASSDGAERSG